MTEKDPPDDMEYIRNVVNFFTGSNEEDHLFEEPMTLNETVKYLKTSEDDTEDPIDTFEKEVSIEIPENKCFEASGKVTHIDAHYGIIGKNLYFETNNNRNIKVGMTLQYLAYKQNGEVKISKILFEKKEGWQDEVQNKEFQFKNTFHSCPIFQVIERIGRIIKLSQDFEVDLNKVESDFVPVVGDYVSVETLVEEDVRAFDRCGRILGVFRLYPLRFRKHHGFIRGYDKVKQLGEIDNDIYFHKDNCAPGYLPVINDAIISTVIECQNGKFNWRALKVMPVNSSVNKFYIAPPDKDEKELLKDKHDIILADHVSANLQRIGEKHVVTLQVRNVGITNQTLIGCIFRSSAHDSQCLLESPKLDNPFIIKPRQTIFLKILVEAKFMGLSKEMAVVSFEGFTIGRWIKITVVAPMDRSKLRCKNYNKPNINLADAAWTSFKNASNEVVAGQRPVKPPSFITNKLQSYEIPERFAKRVFDLMGRNKLNEEPLKDIVPVFDEELSIQNYTDYFHYLLYLEELAVQVNIRKYDMPAANFERDGEYLVLSVPDLTERRPSIIIGDKILAINPRNPEAKPLEGHIHKTGKQHVWLKFNPNFHDMYKGEDYTIEFHSSRSNFRRYHQAVDLAYRNLGEKMLFPVSVPVKPPQIRFVVKEEQKPEKINGNIEEVVVPEPEIVPTNKEDDSEEAIIERKRCAYFRNAYKSIHSSSSNVPLEHQAKIPKKPTKPQNKIQKMSEEMKKPVPSAVAAQEDFLNPVLTLEWYDKKLNTFQKEAVKNILKGIARPLPYFIFGPPGTGKTVTLIETILQILHLMPDSRLLVCAPSNSAADLIALRLLDSNILRPGDLVRMVAYRCVNDGSLPERLLPYCVTGDLAREGSRENRNLVEKGVTTNLQASQLGRHRITIGTCMVVSVLYAMGFSRGHFTHIIVDEAGQATEPEIMIPMSMVDVKNCQVILAGDPRQLGPCVFSVMAREVGLGDSLFERLIFNFPYERDIIGFPESAGYDPRLVTKLVYNYRSLPELLTCPNNLFYNNELRATISEEDSEEAKLLRKISSIIPSRKGRLPPALVFNGCRGHNLQTQDCPSWFNPQEAGQVFYYINKLYQLGVSPKDIGVITPYIRQGQHVTELLMESELPLPKIGSVEEFQGQEFRIVILSCVRSNEVDAQNDTKYGLGFIASPRRLNVAISRAQSLLIIIGNPHLLVMDSYWRNVLCYAIEIGGYTGCDLPNIG